MKIFNFRAQATQAEMQLAKRKELSSGQKLISQIGDLDLEARAACISFLIEQYPQLKYEQAQKLIGCIFDN